ncbi:hypothetical protein WA026_022883 [Henosepilachna vigintioctopunctata]|uniref:adenylate cyclase n=1 Tax=Henosepilachna vigintioctopunctata TaxID=420089 RepID=A0AAW1U4H7_9CUCU
MEGRNRRAQSSRLKYVQQTANSPVDMRVGIHTGAVLAGVLGQRQWQFDVYSKDVELANKMESSGMAGRVHISATTMSFLDGEFEVEPGYGEKREEALRIAGLKTYFIVKVLKPFQPTKSEFQNGNSMLAEEERCIDLDDVQEKKGGKSKAAFESGTEGNSIHKQRQNSVDMKKRLRKELITRDGHRELIKNTEPISLIFIDQQKEEAYSHSVGTPSATVFWLFFVIKCSIILSTILSSPRYVLLSIFYLTRNASHFILIVLCFVEGYAPLNAWFNIFGRTASRRKTVTILLLIIFGVYNYTDSVSELVNLFLKILVLNYFLRNCST